MRLILFLVFILTALAGSSQTDGTSDPKAREMLKKLADEYNAYSSMELSFDLLIDLPDEAPEMQKGRVIQQGNKYMLDLRDQAIYCDGAAVWVHLKSNNEVQINDIDEEAEESFLTPRDMMTIYDSDDYQYAITGSERSGNISLTLIEFKPLDKDSEYSKLRISIESNKNRIYRMEIFSRDGSRYFLDVKDIISNQKYPETAFVFDPGKYPGIHVEDLRL